MVAGSQHPKKGGSILCAGEPVKYAFIAIEISLFPLSVLCGVMGVTQSGFHAWVKRLPSKTEQERERLSHWYLAHL